MKIIDKKGLSGITKIFIDITFIIGIIIYITLPLLVKSYYKLVDVYYIPDSMTRYLEYTYSENNQTFILIFLYCTGILALTILFFTRKLLISIHNNNPFCMENVKIFKIISYCSLFITLFYIIKIFVDVSIPTIVLTFVFLILFSLSLILSELFRKATEYKNENDLTI